MAWRLATSPTRRSPLLLIATIEGVARAPSAFGITTASPASITATHEFVVPKSIPITFGTVASYTCTLFISCCVTLIAIDFCKQFIHHLRHIAYHRNGTAILHTCRANYSQQSAYSALLAVASYHQADIFHLIPLILAANNYLYAIGLSQLRGKVTEQASLLQPLHNLSYAFLTFHF